MEINKINIELIQDFVNFIEGELNIKTPPKIILALTRDGLKTTASYNYSDETKKISVYIKDRAIVDVLRSIAHEMVHHQQYEKGKLKEKPADIGGEIEDEANAVAGRFIKMYAQKNKQIYESKSNVYILSEKQIEYILKDIDEEDENTETKDGVKPMKKWESGVDRGAGNQIGNTKWSEVVGSEIVRDKANPLWEQMKSDYSNQIQQQNIARANKLKLKYKFKPIGKHVYKQDDGENIFVNIGKGEVGDALLDLREFMFSKWGGVAQVVVGILGAEFGAPIAIRTLDYAIALNDILIYGNQGLDNNPPSNVKGIVNRFKWLIQNNNDFLRIVEDFIFLSIGQVIKGSSSIINYFKGSENKIIKFFQFLSKGVNFLLSKIKTLPNYILNYIQKYIPLITKFKNTIELFLKDERRSIRTIGKIPSAIIGGAITALILDLGLATTSWLFAPKNIDISKITPENLKEIGEIPPQIIDSIKNQDKKVIEELAYKKTLSDFPNLKRSDFKMSDEKYNGEIVFIINNKKYCRSRNRGFIEI
jgi:hypothetical protein